MPHQSTKDRKTRRTSFDLLTFCRTIQLSHEPDFADSAFHVETDRHRRINALGIDPDIPPLFQTFDVDRANAFGGRGRDARVSGKVDGGLSKRRESAPRSRVARPPPVHLTSPPEVHFYTPSFIGKIELHFARARLA